MKAAFMTLHYGLDYLADSIASVIDAVDVIWFLYTPDGSFGAQQQRQCPDHARDLFETARAASGDKFHWYTASPGQWRSEGEHCDFIHRCVPGAFAYLKLDADEIWTPGLAQASFAYLDMHPDISALRLPMVHYWRSFKNAVTNDPAYPVRVSRAPGHGSKEMTCRDAGVIHHFGYAQRSDVVEYKQHLSAHRAEWRADWYAERFAVNAQVDVHPTSVDYWNPAAVDPFALGLPERMRLHPYASLEIIP